MQQARKAKPNSRARDEVSSATSTEAGPMDQPSPTTDNESGTNDSNEPTQQLPQSGDQLQRELKRLEAENKILSDANDSLEQKLIALQERQADQEHAHTALAAQHQHVLRLIRAAESEFYDIHLSDICASGSGSIDWACSFGKMVAALKPMFMYRE
jgi:predicted  nucleic acid-binding Zn-ribbon protein